MTSTDDEELDIATWLCTIHLERYQDSFRHHGYHKVKDILFVDNDVLQKIGVGATGHRKRIIGRLRHPSGELNALQSSKSIEKTDSQEYPSKDDVTDTKRNSSEKISDSEFAVRPVPKPRTVFNKYNTNTTSGATISVIPSSVSVDSYSSVSKRPSHQEMVVSRGNSLDKENCNEPKLGGVELEAGIAKHTSAEAGKSFHPIPTLPMRQNKESLQPGSSYKQHKIQMEPDTMQCSPLLSLPSFAGSEEEVTSFSTSTSSPQETLTMISNEIYSGFGSRTDSVSCASDAETLPLNMNSLETIKQEATLSPEGLKSPTMRNSTIKPAQMRKSPSPIPAWTRDGVSPRPAPVGISASPTSSRVKTSPPTRQVPAGYQTHLPPTQKNSVSVTFSSASLRPNPVGDSGSPRLPRTGQVTFPRPPPIGHSASPLLPRGKHSSPIVADKTKNDSPLLANPAPSKQLKKKQTACRQDGTGNTSAQRQRSAGKTRPATDIRSNSTGSPLPVKEISHRPTPVGNAGTSSTPPGIAPPQKSFLMRYSTAPRPLVLKNAPTTPLCPVKLTSSSCLDVAEQAPITNMPTVPDNYSSKRPSPMGMSPCSTLKKSSGVKPAPVIPSPGKGVSSLLTLQSKVSDISLSHNGNLETAPKAKSHSGGWVPRTKSIGVAAVQKVKLTKNNLSPQPTEKEQYQAERTTAKGNKFSPKQKPAEKYGLSIQKSAGSITFQRPKQTGNTSSQTPKCRNVVSSTKNSQQNVTPPRPLGNAELAKPTSYSTISLSKVIKNIPSARPKQKDMAKTNTGAIRLQPLGNNSPVTSKLKTMTSSNLDKPNDNITRTPPKKIASQLLPKLPFMQKKSPKMTIMKNSISRAEENSYLVCSPGWKPAPNGTLLEENDVINPLPEFPPVEDSLDIHDTFPDSWDTDLTEESLEAALRANASIFKPIQDEHLVLVRPRLFGSHINDEYLEQKYRVSKATDG